MMSSPSIRKYLEIAHLIESRMVGTEGARVSSAREVAAEYGVSVVTASRALQVLRDKNLIRTVARSGSFVAPPLQQTDLTEHYALVQRSTPGPWFQASLAFSRAGFAMIERRENVRFELDRFQFDDSTRPAELKRQARRAVESGLLGVIFLPSRHADSGVRQDEVFLRSCRDLGLAVVLVERNLRGLARPLEYDLVAADDLEGGLRCTQHLLDQGRRCIAFLTGSPTSSHEGRLAGYLTALYHAQTGWGPLVLEQPPALVGRNSYGELADRIVAQAADGVVCFQDYSALGLILELLNRGIQVPRDIGITGFDNLPIGKAYSIGVTTYAVPSESFARHATRLVRARLKNPSEPVVKVLIPGELIVRESSG